MKTKFLALLVVSALPAAAAPLTGEKLDVWSGTANSVADTSAAIGAANTVSASQSLAVGWGNTISAFSESFTAGHYNQVSGDWSSALGGYNNISGTASVTAGAGNTLTGDYSMAVGYMNSLPDTRSLAVGSDINIGAGSAAGNLYVGYSLYGANNTASIMMGSYSQFNGSYNSAIFGQGNTATSLFTALVAGSSNVVNGKQFVLGTGLIAQDTAQAAVVVGQYNLVPSSPPPSSPKQLFVVGNGTGVGTPQNRKNALEVYTDGSIRMPAAQGDISMGEFGP